jgi:hypothetical protein
MIIVLCVASSQDELVKALLVTEVGGPERNEVIFACTNLFS